MTIVWRYKCFREAYISIGKAGAFLKAEVSKEILKWHSHSLSLSAEL